MTAQRRGAQAAPRQRNRHGGPFPAVERGPLRANRLAPDVSRWRAFPRPQESPLPRGGMQRAAYAFWAVFLLTTAGFFSLAASTTAITCA